MKKIIIIQARTNSKRLPGKVILPIVGIPQIVLASKRASNTGLNVLVAISNHKFDDNLANILKKNKIKYYRGSLNNPLKRFVEALIKYNDDTIVVRLTGDNLFPDGNLINEIITTFIQKENKFITTNDIKSGLPKGVSVEVTKLKYLREAEKYSKNKFEKEHVTPFIIKKYGKTIFTKYHKMKSNKYVCTVDTFEDYILVSKIFELVKTPISVSCIDLIKNLKNLYDK